MPQNQEEIEAKLAAYIDGELDAAGRAEIEKHLQTNPQHRMLIADLTQQRDLVRALPRENAPSDISETLQGQLERSVLLGSGLDSGEEVSLRISPWPHRGAIAAVILLTAGLGFLVYKVLPSNKPTPGEIAIAPTQAPSPATLSTEQPAKPETPIASRRDLADKAKNSPTEIAKAPAADTTPSIQSTATPPPSDATAAAPTAAAPAGIQASVAPSAVASPTTTAIASNLPAAADRLAPPQPGTTEALGGGVSKAYGVDQTTSLAVNEQNSKSSSPQIANAVWRVVVRTDNPSAADAQVRAFLIANQICFQPIEQTALNDSDRLTLQNGNESVRRSAAVSNSTGALSSPTTLPSAPALSLTNPTTQPALVVDAEKSAATQPAITAGKIATDSNALTLSAAPSTQPISSPTIFSATQPLTIASPSIASPTTPSDSGELNQPALICSNITPAQVNDLQSMLARRAGQSAEIVAKDSIATSVAASTQPSEPIGNASNIAANQKIPQTSNAYNAANANNNGAQLQQQIPADQTQSQLTVPQQGLPQAAAQSSPTTAPTTAPVSSAVIAAPAIEQKVDLVILIQGNPLPATPSGAAVPSATAPSTPLNPPATTQPAQVEPLLKAP